MFSRSGYRLSVDPGVDKDALALLRNPVGSICVSRYIKSDDLSMEDMKQFLKEVYEYLLNNDKKAFDLWMTKLRDSEDMAHLIDTKTKVI